MSEHDPSTSASKQPVIDKQHSPSTNSQQATRRWWIKLFVQPVLLLACGAILIAGLGVAQQMGFISSGGSGKHQHAAVGDISTRYICPMMCTPPQATPGRCPVCAMELVPATSGGGNTDSRSVHIDPATRRVANIQTVAVTSIPITRTIRAIGELSYDEGTLKTISAYVDGRLDRLYADYTGVEVKQGDHLALVYSPSLYSSQVELLLAKKASEDNRSSTLQRVAQSNQDMYESAKQRILELGMTRAQIEQLEQDGKANSRMHLCAPISGTVIKKLAVEGQYVKVGDAIYQLADLSTVWLMLKLFPEDAATVHYGQKVEAEVQSLPGKKFFGRVAFIDPNVDPKTRTVGVRVGIDNRDGNLRVGDYAKATINVPISNSSQSLVYDPELANKWISPRHPQFIATEAGTCPICNMDLVPASQFGFTDQELGSSEALVVPRDTVLMVGNNSVLYVETMPGRFEIRRVVLGPNTGDQIVILSGVQKGELVASRGNFLIDSQMQLAGNPSLIDPQKLQPILNETKSAEMLATISKLPPETQALIEKQRICPVAEYPLGSMGIPKQVDVNGRTVFICCESCRAQLMSEPEKYIAKLSSFSVTKPSHDHSPNSPPMDLPPIGTPEIIVPDPSESKAGEEPSKASAATDSPARSVAELPKEAVR